MAPAPASRSDGERVWSDASYSAFYANSEGERGIVNKAATAAGLDPKKLEEFQAAFAEWTDRHGLGIRSADLRPFLAQLGVQLSPPQVRALWQDYAPEKSQHLPYAEALYAFRQVAGVPVPFKNVPNGAAPPGKALALVEEVAPAPAGSAAAAAEAFVAAEEAAAKRAAAPPPRRRAAPAPAPASSLPLPPLGARPEAAAGGGLRLEVGEARELLEEEGIPSRSIEQFLAPFASDSGTVPQAALFDFLSRWSGALGEDGDEVEPCPVLLSERKEACGAPALPRRAPVLA